MTPESLQLGHEIFRRLITEVPTADIYVTAVMSHETASILLTMSFAGDPEKLGRMVDAYVGKISEHHRSRLQ